MGVPVIRQCTARGMREEAARVAKGGMTAAQCLGAARLHVAWSRAHAAFDVTKNHRKLAVIYTRAARLLA